MLAADSTAAAVDAECAPVSADGSRLESVGSVGLGAAAESSVVAGYHLP